MFQFSTFDRGEPGPRFIPALAMKERDDPGKEIVFGACVVSAFVLCTAVWGLFVPLNAAITAQGVVKVSGDRQKVQGVGDGVISAIRVFDGNFVRAGQPLVDFAAPDLVASERSFASRVIALQAEIARLDTELSGRSEFTAPPEFASYTGPDAKLAADAFASERSTLASRRANTATAKSILAQRIAEANHQISGSTAQNGAIARERELLHKEVDSIRDLARQGFASQNRVLELERSEAELSGSSGSATSEAARLRANAGEARLQLVQQEDDLRQTNATRLRDARGELQILLPQWAAAREQLRRLEARAPVSGVIVGLNVHTVGGVVQRGETLMEIVPADRALTIEAQVNAADGNEVSVGKQAILQLPGLHGRNIPELFGRVAWVSADTLVDEKTGRSYYAMRVQVTPSDLAAFKGAVGDKGVLRPGNPVRVSVKTRDRSALEYWIEPLSQAMAGGLHEH